MKKIIIAFYFLLFSNITLGQHILKSGEYDNGLRLAYDCQSNKITGYYENFTGWNEDTKTPRFSCIFYIEGDFSGQKTTIRTYFPEDKNEDTIEGYMEVVNEETINIKLPEDHGGCWNVQHFADKPEAFKLEKNFNWIQIRYVNTTKSYFHKEQSNDKKLKSYLIKGDIVFIEKIENEWVFCSYFGKKTIKAWLKVSDLNKL
ncbi:hypothetical protein FSS13T_17700 [Flavobacterium saliperosum S13]|uniref:Uncharacterized protein n=2 Tax=Flavobacterium saliperosum TaxID=329186 RepID=A0A1G4VJH3_9FLAO|nr:hypothetical protein [Flavobacterium saliperosum]ESU25534.1 hypothetical protein FSS13T_17700 [Flavobacterium saliperosum S13]SCX07698.1 hypothetical protein SAMN02927925_01211 [Flavobacterium saliperosum]